MLTISTSRVFRGFFVVFLKRQSDNGSGLSQAVCRGATMSSSLVGMLDLSDEILLCILGHVPVCDLLLNVSNVCHKLQSLCRDKTLLSHVSLSEEYQVVSTDLSLLQFTVSVWFV